MKKQAQHCIYTLENFENFESNVLGRAKVGQTNLVIPRSTLSQVLW